MSGDLPMIRLDRVTKVFPGTSAPPAVSEPGLDVGLRDLDGPESSEFVPLDAGARSPSPF